MLLAYIVSAVVAGVLVVLSLLGVDHAGGDADVSVDHEFQLGHDLVEGHDMASGHVAAREAANGRWMPFLSLRFWTYLFAGFGTSGLLLTVLAKTPEPVAAIVAALVGLACGFVVSWVMRLLRITESSSSAKQQDMLGKEAEVLVTIRGTTPGRIRLSVKGDLIDFLAVAPDGETIEPGASVVVLEVEGDRANVARRESVLGDDTLELGQGK